MTKVGEGLKSVVPEPAEYYTTVFVDGKIWLFGLTYKDQKTHNWGHRVAFHGGHVVAFDVNSGTWEGPYEIPELSDEENQGELFFVRNNALHLLLYKEFLRFEPKALYTWDTASKSWQGKTFSMSGSAIADGCECNPAGVKLVDDEPSADTVTFFVNHGKTHLYEIDLNSGHVSKRCDLNKEEIINGAPVLGCKKDDKVYFFFAVHGCVYRWESGRLQALPLSGNGNPEPVQIQGEPPHFGFTGSRFTHLRPNGEWGHATGAQQVGMCDSRFVGDVHNVKFGEPAVWEKSATTLEEAHKNIAYDYSTDTLYTISDEAVEKHSF
ncbi:unnamed protein product, partial [Mesorhabditis spiculigera]